MFLAEEIGSYFAIAWSWIAAAGWYIVGLAVLIIYFSDRIKSRYNDWIQKKNESEYAAKYHKNPDLLQARLSGMEAARQRMQEKYAQDAARARELEKERIERKKQELLKLTEKIGGEKLGHADDGASSSKNTRVSSLKGEYNPLMGDTGRGYRAPKKSCCSKGGCS